MRAEEVFRLQNPLKEASCLAVPELSMQKFVMLEFFNPHCSVCVLNLPFFNKLSEELATKTTARMVALNGPLDQLKKYIKKYSAQIKVPVLYDENISLKPTYRIDYWPAVLIIDSQKKIIYQKVGLLDEDDLNDVRQLIKPFK